MNVVPACELLKVGELVGLGLGLGLVQDPAVARNQKTGIRRSGQDSDYDCGRRTVGRGLWTAPRGAPCGPELWAGRRNSSSSSRACSCSKPLCSSCRLDSPRRKHVVQVIIVVRQTIVYLYLYRVERAAAEGICGYVVSNEWR